MKLEEWVRKDMTRYIKEHEPELQKVSAVRHEDYGLVKQVDYERRIKRAIEQGRFKEATAQFNELKQVFMGLPPDHQEEKKQYYRMLQKSYKRIYDYVEDRHKTRRLLDKLDDAQDVFDANIAPKNLKQEATNPEMAPLSIEERMFRKQPAAQDVPDEELPDVPAPEDDLLRQTKPQEVQDINMPQAPELAQPTQTAQEAAQERIENQDTQTPSLTPDPEHGPEWKPPEFDFTKKQAPPPQPTQQEPQPTPPPAPPQPSQEDVIRAATKELLTQASKAIQEQELNTAQTKLIEARFEATRTHDENLLRAVEGLERQLAASQTLSFHPQKDAELFSSLYLQGVQAMRAGNYEQASKLFAKRTQQAPGDHAARIRYKECMEVLNETTR